MPGNIKTFLDRFSKDSKLALPLPILWSVAIDGINQGAIDTALQEGGEKWKAKNSIDSYVGDDNILVAQEVSLISEVITPETIGIGPGRGGFLPGYGLTERSDFISRLFTINFLETHEDIEHTLFRPWIIAIGIQGLIKSNLKATVTVKQYGNDGSFRKGYKFHKAFPLNAEGGLINYTNSDFIIKTVSFGCENYEQL